MKNKILIKIFILSVILFGVYSCTDDDDNVTAQAIQPAVLQPLNINSTIVLNSDLANQTALTLAWDDADYDVNLGINYDVQVDVSDTFSNPAIVKSSTLRTTSITVGELNTAVSNAGLAPFEDGVVYLRIKSSIGSENVLEQFSNVESLTVHPFTTVKPRLFVIGAYQEDSGYGTMSAEAPQVASSVFGNNSDYEGFVYFANDNSEFQLQRAGFSGEFVDGNPIYGNNGGNAEEGASGAFQVATAGFYRVNVNLDTGAVSMTVTDWGIIGPGSPAGNWDGDVDMTYNVAERVWEITGNTSAGEFKYRANDAWDINFGTDEEGDGSLNFGGPNFSATGGSLKFELDLSTPRAYTQRILNN